jgi:hypothetical protein
MGLNKDTCLPKQKLDQLVRHANRQNHAGLSIKEARLQYGDILDLNWPGHKGDREVEVISDNGVICMACAPGSIFDFMAESQ